MDADDRRYWPTRYLIGVDGVVRYKGVGEGGYGETDEKDHEDEPAGRPERQQNHQHHQPTKPNSTTASVPIPRSWGRAGAGEYVGRETDP